MIILFVSEFTTYLEVKTGSEMIIDVNRGGEKVSKKYITNKFVYYYIYIYHYHIYTYHNHFIKIKTFFNS